ncbi:MAG: DUF4321 domain-containing protein [Nitrospirae bacterium]|nr:DUF4321 domain-containing protein [Nitrospirota bacterium]
MATSTKSAWSFIMFLLLGGLFGGLLGQILRAVSPEGIISNIFLKGYTIGIIPPFTLDLSLVTLTIGFTIRLTIFSILGIFLGVYIYKQV